ncbi:SUZ domain-containing protein 1 [Eurytemora carolleeae]|uniref:SUZ domain-containing protein 1 n=1 Tax=Eurytemora carolleeae TaxID=1294199 RepID=UPI000C782ED1|nr:SUZ domain-containing protein 1 [Eurytemora carolleeae]|eukprot:XP_023322796.1 SUZ domain-containing protein 1-like [Eurytemora affinis]
MTDGIGEGEDWETLLDSGKLDESLSKLKILERKDNMKPRIPSSQLNNSGTITDPTYSGPVRILTNGYRPEYRSSEPKLKILKRPEPESSKPVETPTQKNVQKSLEQREAEYAEARLRILGNPPPPPTNNNKVKQNNKKAGEGKKNPNGNAAVPKGPDGSKGFQNRR